MDCLKRFRERTRADRSVEQTSLDAIDSQVAVLIDRAVAESKAAAPPVEADLYTDVYIKY
jgi:pyruvate dehydrogenase E1 component alpha subunit